MWWARRRVWTAAYSAALNHLPPDGPECELEQGRVEKKHFNSQPSRQPPHFLSNCVIKPRHYIRSVARSPPSWQAFTAARCGRFHAGNFFVWWGQKQRSCSSNSLWEATGNHWDIFQWPACGRCSLKCSHTDVQFTSTRRKHSSMHPIDIRSNLLQLISMISTISCDDTALTKDLQAWQHTTTNKSRSSKPLSWTHLYCHQVTLILPKNLNFYVIRRGIFSATQGFCGILSFICLGGTIHAAIHKSDSGAFSNMRVKFKRHIYATMCTCCR